MPALTFRGQRNPELLRRAVELRARSTPEEGILWSELRGNRLGVHFRRQQILAPYIVDFYCHAAALVIEIDGSPHRLQQGYDRMRDEYFKRNGIRVLRLPNALIRNDKASALTAVREALRSPTPVDPQASKL